MTRVHLGRRSTSPSARSTSRISTSGSGRSRRRSGGAATPATTPAPDAASPPDPPPPPSTSIPADDVRGWQGPPRLPLPAGARQQHARLVSASIAAMSKYSAAVNSVHQFDVAHVLLGDRATSISSVEVLATNQIQQQVKPLEASRNTSSACGCDPGQFGDRFPGPLRRHLSCSGSAGMSIPAAGFSARLAPSSGAFSAGLVTAELYPQAASKSLTSPTPRRKISGAAGQINPLVASSRGNRHRSRDPLHARVDP